MPCLLATFCYDFDLAGRAVWVVLVVAIAGALATARFRFPPEAVQRRLVVLLPAMMLGLCLLTRLAHSRSWFDFFYKCYEAQLDIAFIISLAFAAGFTIAALRERHWFSRTCGVVYSAGCVWLFYESLHYIARMHHWYEPAA
jgi:hypothetical protein